MAGGNTDAMNPMDSASKAADGVEILVVEDDADSLWLATTLLGDAGYEVRPASDGALAVRSAKAKAPGLVLLDIMLPGIDGFEVCRQLKAEPSTATVPVIFMSVRYEDDEKGKAFQAGGVDYITKPIHREELLARLDTHLTIARARRELTEARDAARHAESAARLSLRRLRATLYGIGGGVIATDAAGRVQMMNEVAESLTGWTEADARDAPLTEVFRILNEDTRAAVESPVELVLRKGEVVGLANHTLLIARDGTERPIADSGVPVRDDDDRIVGVVLVFREQNAGREAERALQRSNVEYRAAIENLERSDRIAQAERDHLRAVLIAAPAAIFVIDDEGRAQHVNPAADRLFRTTGNGATRHTGDVVGCIHREDDARGCDFGPSCGACSLYGAVKEGLAGQVVRDREMELEIQGSGGSERKWVVTNAEPLWIDGKRAAVLAMRDVTELRREQREREEWQASLIQSDRLASMGMLAAGIAHEVNNPLAYVLLNLETLAQDLPKLAAAAKRCRAALREHVGDAALAAIAGDGAELLEPAGLDDTVSRAAEALGGVRRIRTVTKGLGTFSRVEQVELSGVDVASAMESAVSMALNEVKYRAQLVKNLTEVPVVWASEGKLAQVFLNLIVNAAQAIDEGHVERNRITVSSHTDGVHVYAEVSDTGSGIPPENLARVFEPFFTSKGVGKGSGLGLAICRNLVTEFGGDIRIESEVGQGTRVVVRLPVMPKQAELPLNPARTEKPPAPTVRGRLLVVDDEVGIRSAMTRLLGRAHEVVTAASGAEAQALLKRDAAFDVILCDLMMPDMTGMDLHEWLTTHDAALAAKMIFVTGGAYTPHASMYLARAGNLRIEKPFDAAMLAALIARRVQEASSDA